MMVGIQHRSVRVWSYTAGGSRVIRCSVGICVWRGEAASVSLRGVSIVGPGVLNVVLIAILSRLLLATHESPVARAVLGLLLTVSVPCSSSSLHSPYSPSVVNYPSNSLSLPFTVSCYLASSGTRCG